MNRNIFLLLSLPLSLFYAFQVKASSDAAQEQTFAANENEIEQYEDIRYMSPDPEDLVGALLEQLVINEDRLFSAPKRDASFLSWMIEQKDRVEEQMKKLEQLFKGIILQPQEEEGIAQVVQTIESIVIKVKELQELKEYKGEPLFGPFEQTLSKEGNADLKDDIAAAIKQVEALYEDKAKEDIERCARYIYTFFDKQFAEKVLLSLQKNIDQVAPAINS